MADNSNARKIWGAIGWTLSIVMVCALYRGAYKFGEWEKGNATPPPQPAVIKTRPGNGETGVLPNAFVAADVFLPNFGHGIDARTMNTRTVRMYRIDGDKRIEVPGHVNTSGAGDAIVFQPSDDLEPDATYEFECNGVRDTSGGPQGLFKPYSSTFTTASASSLSEYPVAFDKIMLPETDGTTFTGLTVGPDHRLYAGTFDGRILRYDFLPDGKLSEPFVIKSVMEGNRAADGTPGHRLITGICFDPHSTPDNLILWITHGLMGVEHMPDWGCKVSRLTGADLANYEDYVVGLPRAWRDHLTFMIAFGPDGALYFDQGSSSSTGAPDTIWGLRNEHLLTAACLRLDTAAVAKQLAAGRGPLNVKTEDDGHYDPFAPDAPLTLYATGIRSGFGLLWHSNGHLYSCINGGARGGAAPASPDSPGDVPRRIDQQKFGAYDGPRVPGIETVNETQPDLFLMIEQGAYYGHPNATRGEYVLFGGNPDGKSDRYQVHDYPLGVKPDRNWHPAIWNLGISYSCNGLIECKSNAFGGALRGKILTTRYSGGKDILLIDLDSDGKVAETVAGIDGFTQFIDPLDLAEDAATGNLYVSEFGGQKLTLLKPRQPGKPGEKVVSKRTFRQTANGAVVNVQ
jgi:hypothetical protein